MAEIVENCPESPKGTCTGECLPKGYHEEDVIELHPTENISEELIMSNSQLDSSTETKPDSGIEDKDSHPNSPAGAKYNLNGTMTCDVREKIQKNRAEEKSIEQIKRERQKAKEEKYGPNRPRRNAKSLGPNAPGFKPGQFQREKRFQPKKRASWGGQPKMGPRETARQQQKRKNANQAPRRPAVAAPKVAPPKPPHKPKRFSPKLNQSQNESILRHWGPPTKGVKWADESLKGSKVGDKTFENFKVTCKTTKKGKGKKDWSRKVESPVAEAKREASKELMTLIQGKNSTIQDKENASKHLLALIHGSQKNFKPSPARSEVEKTASALKELSL